MDNKLEELNKQIKQCEQCSLRPEATAPVCGSGEIRAKYFVLGEAPGANEDSYGLPFVGAAGKRLDKLLALAGITQNECYLTNVCKCRPPANRTPRKSERLACYQYLQQELEIIKPQYVITLGATPLSLFSDQGIRQMHGTMFDYNGYKIIAQYHPAAALHNPRLWAVMLDDWQNMPEKVDTNFTIADVFKPESNMLLAMDTENDITGDLGAWSVAYRQEGQLKVHPAHGSLGGWSWGDNLTIMHNAKWDLRVLDKAGMKRPNKYGDTMIAAYCLGLGRQDTADSSKDRSGDSMVGGLGLKYLARRHLGAEMKTWEQVKDTDGMAEYNAMDSVATYLLYECWAPHLPQHYFDIDMPLLGVCMSLEDRGIRVDPHFLKRYADELDVELGKIELPLNPYSPKQVQDYIYGTLGVEPTIFTDTKQPSTDKNVLEQIDDPIVKQILKYRDLYKERKTYVSSYATRMDPENRIHPEFKQTSTATGRLSCARPNLQNVTTANKSNLRKLFVPKPGYLLVVLDYKKLEFGVQAAITQDPRMLEAFLHGDVHQETADGLGLSYDDGKRVNYLMQNGGDAWKISYDHGIPIDDAKVHIRNYYKRFPGIKEYHEQQKEAAHEKREVVNYFGRRRRLDSMFSEHWRTIRDGEKEAMATPIQGSAADVVKIAMIDLHYKHHAPMVCQVHDELLFELPEKDAKEYATWLTEYVPTIVDIEGVHFPVEIGIGKTWADAKGVH